MTAKEFAEKYAGRIVRKKGSSSVEGRLVAYHPSTGPFPDYVTIESPTIRDKPNIYYGDKRTWVVFPAKGGWNEPVDTVELVEGEAALITQTDYPHKCPKCSAPAYIGFTSMKCSKNCGG